MRHIALFAALLALLVGHLGLRDRRKGSHNQKTHGHRYDASGSLRSRRASATKRIADAHGGGEEKKPDPFDDDDPFNEDFGEDETSAEDLQIQRYQERELRAMERQERSNVHSVIMEAGGLQTRDDLREEYRQIPNTFKRKDGMPGDELAEYLDAYYPEFGITDERDLIDFFAA